MTTDDRLDEIIEQLAKVREAVVGSCERHAACLERQQEHHRTLYGNGKDGLKTEVDRLKTWRTFLVSCFGFAATLAVAMASGLIKWLLERL